MQNAQSQVQTNRSGHNATDTSMNPHKQAANYISIPNQAATSQMMAVETDQNNRAGQKTMIKSCSQVLVLGKAR